MADEVIDINDLEKRKIERSIRREFKPLGVVPSVRLRSKKRRRNDKVIEIDKWDKIRREDSRFSEPR